MLENKERVCSLSGPESQKADQYEPIAFGKGSAVSLEWGKKSLSYQIIMLNE